MRMLAVVVLLPWAASAQVKQSELPTELRSEDSRIGTLLDKVAISLKSGDASSTAQLIHEALSDCTARKLRRDCALVRAADAMAQISFGNFEQSRVELQSSLEIAIDLGDLALKADFLDGIANLTSATGDPKRALEIWTDALAAAKQAKSLYLGALVNGSVARQRFLIGDFVGAQKNLTEALQIDELNKYGLKRLHEAYKAIGILSTSDQNMEAALKILEGVQQQSRQADDWYAETIATQTIALIDAKEGKVDAGLKELSRIAKRNRSVLSQILDLENYAGFYETAGRREEALQEWDKLHALGISQKNDLFLSEANSRSAVLLIQLKRYEDAVSRYKENLKIAVGHSNHIAILQALSGLTTLIQQHPEISSVAPFYEQLLSEIRAHALETDEGKMLMFSGLVQLGNEYKRLKQFEKAEKAFRAAELLDPDSLTKLGDSPAHKQKLIALLHVQHALALDALNDRMGALLQAYRAFDSATQAGEKQMYEPIATNIVRWLTAEEPYGLLKRLLAENNDWDALRLSESLFFEESWDSKWKSEHAEAVKDTLSSFGSALQKIAGTDDAPTMLEGNLNDIPPEFTGLRISIARQIAQILLFKNNRPKEAKKFLDTILKIATGPNSDRAAFEAQCWMSLANGFDNDGSEALHWSDTCTSTAMRLDGSAQRYARVVESYARLSNGAVPSSDAIKAVTDQIGDKPEFRSRLARALANQRDFEAALGEAERAMSLFKQAGRLAEAANEALYCSFLARQVSPKAPPTKYIETARELFARTADVDGHAQTFIEESYVLEAKGELPQALGAARKAQNRSGRKPTTTNIEATLRAANLAKRADPSKTEGLLRQAIHEAEEISNAGLQSQGLQALAGVLLEQHRSDEAIAAARQAEEVVKDDANGWSYYLAATSTGQLCEKMGDMQAALASYERAAAAAQAKYPTQYGFALNSEARILEILGDWPAAEKTASHAKDIFSAQQYKTGIVLSLAELMSVYGDRGSDLKDLDKALNTYQRALQIDPAATETLGAELIEVLLQQGKFSDAVGQAESQEKACGNDPICIANLEISSAEAYIGLGNTSAAFKELNKANGPITKDGDVYLTGRLMYARGKAYLAAGNVANAVNQLRSVCDLIGRTGDDASDSGIGLKSNYSYIFDDLLLSLQRQAEQGSQEASWAALNYADALTSGLFDMRWRKIFVNRLSTAVPPDLRDKERSINTRILEIKRKLTDGGEKSKSALELQASLTIAERERSELANQIRKVAPKYAEIAYPAPLGSAEIDLKPGEVLVRVHLSPNKIFLWIKQSNSDLKFSVVPADRQRLRDLISEIKRAFDQGRPDLLQQDMLTRISTVVLPDDLRHIISSSKHVIYVPDDCLFLVPLEMLLASTGDAPTVPVTYFPSVRDFVASRAVTVQRNWAKAFIGFADPITGDDDPRLLSFKEINAKVDRASLREISRRGISLDRIPETGQEVNSISKLFDAAHEPNEVYVGSDASKSRVLHTDLTPFRYVHFATHGLLPGEAQIEEPALVLSRGPENGDMLLNMSEVLNLKLNADLVVLSACNTGSGKLAKGEGVMSLGKAFMDAGSSSVAMSLWQVSDVSTALLMRSFYKHLLGGASKPEALAKARKEVYDAGFTNPFFWAPFILVGQ